ncbi:pyridoxal phosphate-dependent aminotransferase [Pseudomonas syringae]
MNTLTDVEWNAFALPANLADGHAYHDMHVAFMEIMKNLERIWSEADKITPPRMALDFKNSFSRLIKSPSLMPHTHYKICPSASNSIDLIAAFLHGKNIRTVLVEPTFDNLALLLQRRGVTVDSVSEDNLRHHLVDGNFDSIPAIKTAEAVFIVSPNNPTGYTLSLQEFKTLVAYCKRTEKLLVVDNSFRFFNRQGYDDYQVLLESGVNFIAFEDTGKTWPTQDLKASLIIYSDTVKVFFESLYNEIYLCVSNFVLHLFSHLFDATSAVGLKSVLWDVVDSNRALLRETLQGSVLRISETSKYSLLSVEWLDCRLTGLTDIEFCKALATSGLGILPGRNFHWESSAHCSNHFNVRISLLKKGSDFKRAMILLSVFLNTWSPSAAGTSLGHH